MTINLTKDPLKIVYTRNFNKVDTYFSYVGGLIGTILGFIFILNAFAEMAYGVSIASQFFRHKDGEGISSRDFHIGYLISVTLYKVCESLGCCESSWNDTATVAYAKCIDEA